jgi:cytochrome c oxidase assembly factor CtaG
MTRWKCVGVSFVSAIIAELMLGVSFSIPDGNHLFFEHIADFVYLASFLVIPGWLIALPIIVVPDKPAHLPTWRLSLIGASIGPALMFAIGIYFAIANHTGINHKREAWYLVGIATLVSGLTTGIYLTAHKLFSHPTQTLSS